MIATKYGDMDESILVKKEGGFEDDNEITSWVEYHLDGEIVHRSVSIFLKSGLLADAIEGGF